MKNLLNDSDRSEILIRLEKINQTLKNRWGKMNVHQVIPHLTDPLKVAIGKRTAPIMNTAFKIWPFNLFVVWFMPWPKGAPTAPEFIQGVKGTPPQDFEKDFIQLKETIDSFTAYRSKFAPSPVFGNISNNSWGRLMWRHLDHHLRQFGL